MSAVRIDPEHISTILARRAPDRLPLTEEEQRQVEQVLAKYVEQQGWQNTVNDLIVRLQTRLQDGPAEEDGITTPVTAYTDGACIGNPGPGGWCAVIGTPEQPASARIILKGSNPETTNNRMEMQAVIAALQHAGDKDDVEIWSDSQYVCKAFNDGWLRRWQSNGWRTTNGAVLNQDLWTRLASLAKGDGKRRVTFRWVRGHAGNPLNEEADKHARAQAQEAGSHAGRPPSSGAGRRRSNGRRTGRSR